MTTQTSTKVNTINVLVVRCADPLNVIRMTSYEDTFDGREEANEDFGTEIKEAKQGLYTDEEIDEIIQLSIVDGCCEVGEGYIALINSV